MTVLQKQFVGSREVYVLTSPGCHVDGIDCVFFKRSSKQSSKKFPCMSCRDLIYLTEGDYAEYLAERLIVEPKHGDMIVAADGRELMAVTAPSNTCRPKDFLGCELSNDTVQCCTARSYSRAPPCNTQPLIFVNKEKYFAYKLLGTTESSD